MDFLIEAWLSMSALDIVKCVVMWCIGGLLIFLAIKKQMEIGRAHV